jgi:hypothetical protein
VARSAPPPWIRISALGDYPMRVIVVVVAVESAGRSVPMAIISRFARSSDPAIEAIAPSVPVPVITVVSKNADRQEYRAE